MKKIVLSIIVFLSIFDIASNAKTTYYVKKNGTGNGSSWSNAAGDIQSMIDKAVSGDQIWVSKGTYYPTTETIPRDARSKTFLLKAGVNIYGGFVGTETSILQRALTDLDSDGKTDSCELVNQTILSGDIDGTPDVWTKQPQTNGIWQWAIVGNEGNCYRVVTNGDGSNVIDGFSISGGNANSSTNSITDGGGIYLKTFCQLKNCIVSNCTATKGGGICCPFACNTYVTNCKVIDCAGTSGGGIYSDNYAYSYIINCKVANCTAKNGGGIFAVNENGDYTKDTNIFYCTVFNCSATSNGGGIYTGNNMYCFVASCYISNCSAVNGGGICGSDASNSGRRGSYFTNCTLTNCSATNGGGIYGMCMTYSCINSCNISNCLAYSYAGGIYALGEIDVTNCALSNNKVGDNLANFHGEDNGIISSSLLVGLENIYPNTNDAYIQPTSFCGVAVSDAQNSELISANWRLKESSPCINAGTGYGISVTSNNYLTNDLDGNPRIIYGLNDIGAYEYVVPMLAMPVLEEFDNLTDWNGSSVFYNSAQLNGNQNIKWTINNQKAIFSWQTNLTSTYTEPFFTYQINATNATNVFLRYDMYFEAYSGSISPLGTEKLNVEYSTDLINWSTLATYSNANGTIADQTYKFDISNKVAGKNFFIRFNANGENSNRIEKWEIDNVIIDTDGLSCSLNTVQANKYLYSKSNNVLKIDEIDQPVTIQLIDMNGKIIAQTHSNAVSSSIWLPCHGVYIVKVFGYLHSETNKIVW